MNRIRVLLNSQLSLNKFNLYNNIHNKFLITVKTEPHVYMCAF